MIPSDGWCVIISYHHNFIISTPRHWTVAPKLLDGGASSRRRSRRSEARKAIMIVVDYTFFQIWLLACLPCWLAASFLIVVSCCCFKYSYY
jgi:hypothetical protein